MTAMGGGRDADLHWYIGDVDLAEEADVQARCCRGSLPSCGRNRSCHDSYIHDQVSGSAMAHQAAAPEGDAAAKGSCAVGARDGWRDEGFPGPAAAARRMRTLRTRPYFSSCPTTRSSSSSSFSSSSLNAVAALTATVFLAFLSPCAQASLTTAGATTSCGIGGSSPDPWGTQLRTTTTTAAAAAAKTATSKVLDGARPAEARRDAALDEVRGGGPPPVALCFDFDQTLSREHLHRLSKGAPGGVSGIDLHAAFGGRERIARLGRFLGDAKKLGAAVHIISHNQKDSIIDALGAVGLGLHFPPDTIVGWGELRDNALASKSEMATRIADGYGIARGRCMLVDDDEENLSDADDVMTYWVSSGEGLSDKDMSTLLSVCRTMRTAPQRLAPIPLSA